MKHIAALLLCISHICISKDVPRLIKKLERILNVCAAVPISWLSAVPERCLALQSTSASSHLLWEPAFTWWGTLSTTGSSSVATSSICQSERTPSSKTSNLPLWLVSVLFMDRNRSLDHHEQPGNVKCCIYAWTVCYMKMFLMYVVFIMTWRNWEKARQDKKLVFVGLNNFITKKETVSCCSSCYFVLFDWLLNEHLCCCWKVHNLCWFFYHVHVSQLCSAGETGFFRLLLEDLNCKKK